MSKALTETLGPPLTLRYRPLDGQGADIDALAFSEYLKQSVYALRETADLLAGRDVPLSYNISDLHKNSPALVELTPRISIADAALIVETQKTHVLTIQAIEHGRIPSHLDYGGILRYRKLGAISKRHRFETDLRVNGTSAVATASQKDRLDLEMARDQWSFGSLRGFIRSYHAVDTKRLMRLYPRTGQPVVCKFRSQDQAKVVSLIDRYVEVSGRMRYRPNAYQAYYMDIAEIRGINVGAAPTFAAMEGFAPGLGGSTPSEDLVRGLRDEW